MKSRAQQRSGCVPEKDDGKRKELHPDMKGSLPIVIGVTGHRKLYEEDLPVIKAVFREELSSLTEKYGASGFVMLNSLASGADQLAAEIALDDGIPLVAVLPFAAEEYRKDFTPEELTRFDALLEKAEAVIIPEAPEEKNDRDSGYRRAGLYVADNAHILYAFWDGSPGKAEGCGTGDIVTYLMEGGEDYIIRRIPIRRTNSRGGENFTDGQDCSFRACIREATPSRVLRGDSEDVVPSFIRSDDDGNGILPIPVTYTSKTISGNDGILSSLEITDAFNRDADEYFREIFRKCGSGTKNSGPATGQLECSIEELYALADALSGKNQKKYLRDLKGLALTGVGMVVAFLFYDELALRICLPLYALLLVFGTVLLRGERKNSYYDNYLRYRMLAECLRVESVLIGAGIRFNAARYYPMTLKKETLWIRKGIDGLLVLSEKQRTNERQKSPYTCPETEGRNAGPEPDSPANVSFLTSGSSAEKKSPSLSRDWLEGQLSYHEGNLLKTRKKEGRNRRISGVLRTFTILTVLFSICFEFSGASLYDAIVFGEPFRIWVLIFMGLLSTGSLLLSLYYGKLALSRKAEDSEHMIALYRRALALAEKQGLSEELIRETAREEILENADWYSYSRENAPEINI